MQQAQVLGKPDREIAKWVESLVEQKLLEMLGDPDAGLPLRPEVRKRLQRSFTAKSEGVKGIPAQEVARSLNLKW